MLSNIGEILQKFWPLAAPHQFLVEKLDFKRLIFIFLSFHRVLQIDLFNELSQEVAIEILAKLIGQIIKLIGSGSHHFLASDLVDYEFDLPNDGLS